MSKSEFKPFFQKLSDNLGASLYERLSSPFFQSFTIAWLSINWEIVYYLISASVNKPAVDRIKFIEENLITTSQVLWKPLGLSFAFLFGYIILSSVGFFIWESFLQFKRWIRGKVLGWRPMDKYDAQTMLQRILDMDAENEDLKRKFGEDRQEMVNKATELGEKLTEVLDQREVLKEEMRRVKNELNLSSKALKEANNSKEKLISQIDILTGRIEAKGDEKLTRVLLNEFGSLTELRSNDDYVRLLGGNGEKDSTWLPSSITIDGAPANGLDNISFKFSRAFEDIQKTFAIKNGKPLFPEEGIWNVVDAPNHPKLILGLENSLQLEISKPFKFKSHMSLTLTIMVDSGTNGVYEGSYVFRLKTVL